jgi:hypothetical protein
MKQESRARHWFPFDYPEPGVLFFGRFTCPQGLADVCTHFGNGGVFTYRFSGYASPCKDDMLALNEWPFFKEENAADRSAPAGMEPGGIRRIRSEINHHVRLSFESRFAALDH